VCALLAADQVRGPLRAYIRPDTSGFARFRLFAIGVATIGDGHVLALRRVVYEGKVYDLQPSEQRKIPIMGVELLDRLRKLGTGREWVF